MPTKTRPRRSSSAKPKAVPALDQAQIIHAALALLDEVGFEGLTMRVLAHRLGIKAASLYWHVRDKQELLGLMANEICAPMRPPDRARPWQQQLEALGRQYRHVLLSHRDAARVLAASGSPSGSNILRLTEMVLRILLDAGFDPRDAVYAGALLNDYVVTFVSEETRSVDAHWEENVSGSASVSSNWFATLPANEYPSLVALSDHLMDFDADKRFRFGTEILIHGLEARLAQRKS